MKRLDHYWYGQNLLSWLLLPMSALYCFISMLRRGLYRLGLLKHFTPPVPVIVIGNISVGGTGKTPLLIELCQQLITAGHKPGVISRGYGGQSVHWPVSVTSDSLAAMIGDEPLLIHSRSGCPVVVGPDRKADIDLLLSEHDCDLILSDDGLQHYRMGRSAEIAVIDGSRGFGNGFCLPSGPLREPVSRLKLVDMQVVNGGDESESSFRIVAGQLNALSTETECVRLDQFKGRTVHAIAGIGNPERFFSLLEVSGMHCIRHPFPDHYAYKAQDVCFDDSLPVLMTEKDAVKCFPFKLDNHWYAPIDVRLSETAQQQFNQIMQQVCHG